MKNPGPAQQFTGPLVRAPWSYKMWMLAGSRERFFDRLIAEFGDFVHYRGLIDFYLVNHPALVRQVLQGTHESFDKRSPLYDRFRQSFGTGLVVAEGEDWRRRRKVVQQLLGPRQVQSYFAIMVDAADRLANEWTRRADDREPFDVAPQMDGLTLEIIGRTLFHDGFNDARESIAHWTKVIDHFSSKAPLPVVRARWFPSRLNRRLGQTLRAFHAFLQQMIDHRRDSRATDLLSLLCRPDELSGERLLTDAEVRDEALGMIVGGHETSSVALTWIWYELARHPEVERQLHEELDTVLGDQPIEPDHIPRLRFTRMVIDECLRLHPPFWFENRNTMCDVTLGGERIPAGSMVVFCRHALHRHPDFWHEPDRFDPTRFQPGSEENSRASHAYVPFGGGPRVCVGIHFALEELVVLVASIARRFRVEVAEPDRGEVSALLTMRLKHGLKVRVSPRRSGSPAGSHEAIDPVDGLERKQQQN